MALKTRVWGAGKLLLLTGALAATFLVFALGSMRLALKTREVEVPDLTNRSANEATAVANGLGLAVRVDEVRRPDRENRRGPRARAGAARRIDLEASAQRPRLAQFRRACGNRAVARRRNRAGRRSCGSPRMA